MDNSIDEPPHVDGLFICAPSMGILLGWKSYS